MFHLHRAESRFHPEVFHQNDALLPLQQLKRTSVEHIEEGPALLLHSVRSPILVWLYHPSTRLQKRVRLALSAFPNQLRKCPVVAPHVLHKGANLPDSACQTTGLFLLTIVLWHQHHPPAGRELHRSLELACERWHDILMNS